MASYFLADPDGDDLQLLPPGQRKANEIAVIAAQAEADVIRFYTRRASQHSRLGFPALAETINENLSLVVFLLGYKVDAEDAATDSDLKQALKETIADVISFRLRRQNKDPAMITEGTDIGKTVTWNSLNMATFPPNFDWRLANFDLREPAWGL